MVFGYLLAQDPTDVMEAAHATGSWEVVLLCFLVVTMVGGFVFLTRMLMNQQNSQIETLKASYESRVGQLTSSMQAQREEAKAREDRMAERITRLEDDAKDNMTAMLSKMMELMTTVETTLASFSESQKEINGDLKSLCQMLELSPCLLYSRGKLKLTDVETGEKFDPKQHG